MVPRKDRCDVNLYFSAVEMIENRISCVGVTSLSALFTNTKSPWHMHIHARTAPGEICFPILQYTDPLFPAPTTTPIFSNTFYQGK